jgi:ATP-dependent helicase HepA
MTDFFPDQRYTSAGEPELGLGIVTEVSKGKVKMHFPIVANETRLYSTESAPLVRTIFKTGDTVMDLQGQFHVD